LQDDTSHRMLVGKLQVAEFLATIPIIEIAVLNLTILTAENFTNNVIFVKSQNMFPEKAYLRREQLEK
jgi:hypothetical protein